MDAWSAQQEIMVRLAVALAVGLLIGLERGWQDREREPGQRVAGVRTYALLGMVGGGAGLIAAQLGVVLLGLAFLAVAGVLTAAYVMDFRCRDEVGITSLVAGLLTFILGALAGIGAITEAGAAAVVAALLLGFKPTLHRWVGALKRRELYAALKLLVISVVLLPVLPDHRFGPWGAVNPYELWWLVVLIAVISFVGYFAVKLVGAERGALYTGLFAGLASSTALTLHFSRMAGNRHQAARLLSTAVLLSCGMMFPRMILVIAVVMLLARALNAWFGDVGVLALAAVSGGASIDAATLYLSRMSHDDLALAVAATAVIIAAAMNNVVKAGMVAVIGGRSMGLRTALPLVMSGLAGVAVVWLMHWA